MITLTTTQKTAIRYIIGLNMSVIFGFLAAGLINSQASYFFGYLPLPIFVATLALALGITAVYASTFGKIQFNVWAIIIGGVAGALSIVLLGRVTIIPYSILLPLSITAVVTTILTFVIKPKIFTGLARLLVVIHVISIFIVAWGVVYSLWNRWLWPWGIVFAIDSFALWSPAIVGACPLTILESDVRASQGQQTHLGQEKFVPHYLKKWLGIKISDRTAKNTPRVIALVMFSWWIVDYLIH